MKYEKPQLMVSVPACNAVKGVDGKPSTQFADAESGRPNALTIGAYEADE